jgi:hypothetical protein
MSLLEQIEKLREKPEEHRRQMAFWFSAGVTAIMALIWVAGLSTSLRGSSDVNNVASVGAVSSGTTSTVTVKSAVENQENQNLSWFQNNKNKVIAGWKVITK